MIAAEFVLNGNAVTWITAFLLPVAVAAVTKSGASDRLRAVVLLVLTAVHTLVTQAVDPATGDAILSSTTLNQWLLTTLIAVFSYLGAWKPIAQINDRLLPSVGLGKAA
jgi:hypothetical protein